MGDYDATSIALFKALGFKIVHHIKGLNEIEMRLASISGVASQNTKESSTVPGWRTGVVKEVSFDS
jgi:hypothetical protein